MNEPQTASEVMMQSQLDNKPGDPTLTRPLASTVLPSPDVQKFLLELVSQANYPGSMSEFITYVKRELAGAQVG